MLTQGRGSEVVADKVRLEKRTHLRVTRARMVQDEEMDLERCHIDEDRQDDETPYACAPMSALIALRISG